MGALSEGITAARKLLDMSREARMARAREQGFDTDRVWYHGTEMEEIDEFIPTAGGVNTSTFDEGVGVQRHAVFFSDDPRFSRAYGTNVGEFLVRDEGFDYPELTRDVQLDFASSIDPFGERDLWLQARYAVEPWALFDGELGRRFQEWSRGQGVKGYRFTEETTNAAGDFIEAETAAVFNPADIRSVNAAFDPAHRNSSNLLAGVGGATVGAGLLAAPQESEASAGFVTKALRRAQGEVDRMLEQAGPEATAAWLDDDILAAGRPRDLSDMLRVYAMGQAGTERGIPLSDAAARKVLDYRRQANEQAEYLGIRLDGPSHPDPAGALERDYQARMALRRAAESKEAADAALAANPDDQLARRRAARANEEWLRLTGQEGGARPELMGALAAVGAATVPISGFQVDAAERQRRREVDAMVDQLLLDFRQDVERRNPRIEAPRFETLAALAEWARMQRFQGVPLYGQPLSATADTLDRLAYDDYRPDRNGLGTLALDAVTTAAEVFDPLTWAAVMARDK